MVVGNVVCVGSMHTYIHQKAATMVTWEYRKECKMVHNGTWKQAHQKTQLVRRVVMGHQKAGRHSRNIGKRMPIEE